MRKKSLQLRNTFFWSLISVEAKKIFSSTRPRSTRIKPSMYKSNGSPHSSRDQNTDNNSSYFYFNIPSSAAQDREMKTEKV